MDRTWSQYSFDELVGWFESFGLQINETNTKTNHPQIIVG